MFWRIENPNPYLRFSILEALSFLAREYDKKLIQ
jgi:hypothetical protein